MVKPVAFLFIKLYPHDIMSVSEREQAKPAHRERRMPIMNAVHDIMSVSEWEQAKPAHRERRMYTIEVKIKI